MGGVSSINGGREKHIYVIDEKARGKATNRPTNM
jgi:hypothetical protein